MTRLEGLSWATEFTAHDSKIYMWDTENFCKTSYCPCFLDQGWNYACSCSSMFYSDCHKLIQLPPSTDLGLVLPTQLQNLAALLSGEFCWPPAYSLSHSSLYVCSQSIVVWLNMNSYRLPYVCPHNNVHFGQHVYSLSAFLCLPK